MKSNVNLSIRIEHGQNLPTPDADGIANGIAAYLIQTLAGDPSASVTVKVQSAAIEGMVPMTVQAVHNA